MTTTKFVFIRQNDPSDSILVVSKNSIETVNIADTYDKYGQKCGHIDAGDCLLLNDQDAADEANRIYNENRQDISSTENPVKKYQVGDYVSAYDFSDVFDKLINSDYEVTLEQETTKAIQYWDGHNFRSFVLEGDGQDGEIIDDEEEIEELETALKEMEYTHKTTGCIHFETEKFTICESVWQGDFERYSISKK